MSQETEWSEGKRWEETSITKDERERLRPWVALGLVLGLGLLMLILGGCATTTNPDAVLQMVCYEQPLGRSEQGLIVVRHFCVKEEPGE